MEMQKHLKAPIKKGQNVGTVKVYLNGKIITKQPLIALRSDPKAGVWGRVTDSVGLLFSRWVDGEEEHKA